MNSRTRRRLELAMPFIVIVALVLIWQAIVAIFNVAVRAAGADRHLGRVPGISRADPRPCAVHAHEHAHRLRHRHRDRGRARHLHRLVAPGLCGSLSAAGRHQPCAERRSSPSWCCGWASASRRPSPPPSCCPSFRSPVIATGLATVGARRLRRAALPAPAGSTCCARSGCRAPCRLLRLAESSTTPPSSAR